MVVCVCVCVCVSKTGLFPSLYQVCSECSALKMEAKRFHQFLMYMCVCVCVCVWESKRYMSYKTAVFSFGYLERMAFKWEMKRQYWFYFINISTLVTDTSAVKWSEVKCSEVKWSEVKWGEVKWGEVQWSEVKWSEMRWSEVKWSELKCSGVKWSAVKWSEGPVKIGVLYL